MWGFFFEFYGQCWKKRFFGGGKESLTIIQFITTGTRAGSSSPSLPLSVCLSVCLSPPLPPGHSELALFSLLLSGPRQLVTGHGGPWASAGLLFCLRSSRASRRGEEAGPHHARPAGGAVRGADRGPAVAAAVAVLPRALRLLRPQRGPLHLPLAARGARRAPRACAEAQPGVRTRGSALGPGSPGRGTLGFRSTWGSGQFGGSGELWGLCQFWG